jgi:hypothetical protein
MSSTITISQMERRAIDGLVTKISWKMSKTVDGSTAIITGQLDITDGVLNTPYDELTEAQVITWVKELLGQAKLVEFERVLDADIEAQQTPLLVPGLPWHANAS